MGSPTGSYNSYTEDRGEPSRKRPQAEPHPAILPPPVPGQAPYPREDPAARRPPVQDDLRLPPVTPTAAQTTSNYSPGSATSSNSRLGPPRPSEGLPSMSASRTPPPRTSPDERADPMSLGSIMEQGPATQDIDRKMLGRLDRKGQ
jgi:hypothetical protein